MMATGTSNADYIENFGDRVTITGDNGNDQIYSNGKNVRIDGEDGNNLLENQGDNSTIIGGTGNDKIYGGAGTDKLFGDAGADTLSGDAGNDVFVYANGEGKDVITDYAAGDKIKISSGSNVIFAIGSGTLTVQNGKGKKITIVDANNKTTTQTYSGAVSSTSKLFADDNFIGGETRLDYISKITAENYSVGKISATDYQNLAQEETFIAYAEK